MKFRLTIAASIIAASTLSASAWDLKEALGNLKSGDSSSSVTDAISGALGGILSTGKITFEQLEGTWNYSAPAVTFKSDNLLKKAGGAAASGVIENKLAPVYKTTGLDQLTMTIDKQGAFSMKVRGITLKGTIQAVEDESSQANFKFTFSGLGKSIGGINAYIEKNITGSMTLTFDVSKLITIMEKISSVTNNSTISTLSKTLSSYDGLCAGFELKK